MQYRLYLITESSPDGILLDTASKKSLALDHACTYQIAQLPNAKTRREGKRLVSLGNGSLDSFRKLRAYVRALNMNIPLVTIRIQHDSLPWPPRPPSDSESEPEPLTTDFEDPLRGFDTPSSITGSIRGSEPVSLSRIQTRRTRLFRPILPPEPRKIKIRRAPKFIPIDFTNPAFARLRYFRTY